MTTEELKALSGLLQRTPMSMAEGLWVSGFLARQTALIQSDVAAKRQTAMKVPDSVVAKPTVEKAQEKE